MDCPDGYLVPDINMRRDIVRVIRKFKPDILVTCDPQTLFATYGINHPDHRAAGQVVLDAVFPAAGSPVFFPELLAEGYQPHMPKEVWCSLTMQPNVTLDVTETWHIKLEAFLQHKTQVGDIEKFQGTNEVPPHRRQHGRESQIRREVQTNHISVAVVSLRASTTLLLVVSARLAQSGSIRRSTAARNGLAIYW